MATLTIKIVTDNDAFANDPIMEVERIILEWIDMAKRRDLDGGGSSKLQDINGNSCGTVTYR